VCKCWVQPLLRTICRRLLDDELLIEGVLGTLPQELRSSHPHCELHDHVLERIAAELAGRAQDPRVVCTESADWGSLMPVVDAAIQALPMDDCELLLAHICYGSRYAFPPAALSVVDHLVCELRKRGYKAESSVVLNGLLIGAPTLPKPRTLTYFGVALLVLLSALVLLVWGVAMWPESEQPVQAERPEKRRQPAPHKKQS
jgi:hypothetical protein